MLLAVWGGGGKLVSVKSGFIKYMRNARGDEYEIISTKSCIHTILAWVMYMLRCFLAVTACEGEAVTASGTRVPLRAIAVTA